MPIRPLLLPDPARKKERGEDYPESEDYDAERFTVTSQKALRQRLRNCESPEALLELIHDDIQKLGVHTVPNDVLVTALHLLAQFHQEEIALRGDWMHDHKQIVPFLSTRLRRTHPPPPTNRGYDNEWDDPYHDSPYDEVGDHYEYDPVEGVLGTQLGLSPRWSKHPVFDWLLDVVVIRLREQCRQMESEKRIRLQQRQNGQGLGREAWVNQVGRSAFPSRFYFAPNTELPLLLWALSKLRHLTPDICERAATVLRHSIATLGSFDISLALYSTAQQSFADAEDLIFLLCEAAIRRHRSFNPIEISMTLQGLANNVTVREVDFPVRDELVRVLSRGAVQRGYGAKAYTLAMTMGGLHKLRQLKEEVAHSLLRTILLKRLDLDTDTISLILHSLAEAALTLPMDVRELVSHVLVAKRDMLTVREASRILYSFVRIGSVPEPPVLRLLYDVIVENIANATVMDCVCALDSLASKHLQPDGRLLNAIDARLCAVFQVSSPEFIARVLHLFAVLRWGPSANTMDMLLEYVFTESDGWSAQTLASLMWALKRLDFNPGPHFTSQLLTKAATEATKAQAGIPLDVTATMLSALDHPGFALQSTTDHEYLVSELLDAAMTQGMYGDFIEGHSPHTLSTFFWAFARFNADPPAALLKALSDSVVLNVAQFSVPTLVLTLTAISSASRLRPESQLIHALANEALQRTLYLSDSDVQNMLTALQRLEKQEQTDEMDAQQSSRPLIETLSAELAIRQARSRTRATEDTGVSEGEQKTSQTAQGVHVEQGSVDETQPETRQKASETGMHRDLEADWAFWARRHHKTVVAAHAGARGWWVAAKPDPKRTKDQAPWWEMEEVGGQHESLLRRHKTQYQPAQTSVSHVSRYQAVDTPSESRYQSVSTPEEDIPPTDEPDTAYESGLGDYDDEFASPIADDSEAIQDLPFAERARQALRRDRETK